MWNEARNDRYGGTREKCSTPASRPSPENLKRVYAWFKVWHRLSRAQQDAYRALPKARRKELEAMTGEEFAKAMSA